MHPILLKTRLFGILSEPWSLHTYGVLIAFGFLLAMGLASRQAAREGEDGDRIIDLAFYILLSGLVGARLVFILTRLDYYSESPARVVMFWLGGLVWYGGFLGAALFVAYYCRRHRLSFLKYADILIPYVALGHVFGRLGCFAAGCCYGAPTSVPWAVVFGPGSMANQGQQSAKLIALGEGTLPVHPTQLYEALLELGLFVALVLLRRVKRRDGELLLAWLTIYAVGRSVIELFRGDAERGVFILSTSQYISVGMMLAAGLLYLHLRRQEGARALEGVPD